MDTQIYNVYSNDINSGGYHRVMHRNLSKIIKMCFLNKKMSTQGIKIINKEK
jgi:hypothetical protein